MLSSIVTTNTRGGHLRLGYQNTHPTCLSENNMWQVRDPGASSHLLRMYFTMKAKWQSWLSKVVFFHYSPTTPPLSKWHIWYSWKQHLTHPHRESWRLSFVMLAPLKARVLCVCPLLWLTRWLWATIAARAPMEHLNEPTVAARRHFQIHWQHYYTKDFI